MSAWRLADRTYIGMRSLRSPKYRSAGVVVLLFTSDAAKWLACMYSLRDLRAAAGLASCGTSFLVGGS